MANVSTVPIIITVEYGTSVYTLSARGASAEFIIMVMLPARYIANTVRYIHSVLCFLSVILFAPFFSMEACKTNLSYRYGSPDKNQGCHIVSAYGRISECAVEGLRVFKPQLVYLLV